MQEANKSIYASCLLSNHLPSMRAGTAPDDSDPEDGEQETYGFRYFLARARYICRDVSDADLQDIVQEAWISFLRKSESGGIDNTEAYIAKIIRNKFRDYLRQEKRRSHLPTIYLSAYTEHPDLELVALSGAGLINPANELDDRIEKMDFFNNLAAALPKLPPRQRYAIICTLLDKVDDPLLFKQALKRNHIDASGMCWPSDKAEKRLLQASLPAARRALATIMCIDLCQYKQRKRRFRNITTASLE